MIRTMQAIMKLLSLAPLFLASTLVADNRPNILWIFCDDMAVNVIGAYDSRFADMNPPPNIDRIANEGKTHNEGHSTDVVTNRALNWFHNMREPNKPFMLMVHYKAPHRAWIPAERFQEEYQSKTYPEPESLFDNYNTCEPAARNAMEIGRHIKLDKDLKTDIWPHRAEYLDESLPADELRRRKYQAYMQDYFACVAGVDENVGRLLKALEDAVVDENTVVMFSSDQGFYLGGHGWFDKRWMYEESFRTPFVVKRNVPSMSSPKMCKLQ